MKRSRSDIEAEENCKAISWAIEHHDEMTTTEVLMYIAALQDFGSACKKIREIHESSGNISTIFKGIL